MKTITLIIAFLFSLNVYAANITTKPEADKFIASYCIDLVNAIHDSKNRAEIKIKNGDTKGFLEEASWIGGLADVYSKLCK